MACDPGLLAFPQLPISTGVIIGEEARIVFADISDMDHKKVLHELGRDLFQIMTFSYGVVTFQQARKEDTAVTNRVEKVLKDSNLKLAEANTKLAEANEKLEKIHAAGKVASFRFPFKKY